MEILFFSNAAPRAFPKASSWLIRTEIYHILVL